LRIEVDCERIRRNAEVIVAMCAAQNIQVAGVTKSCCGHPEVGRAMLAGGVRCLADSRIANLRRMRDAGIDADMMLLRLPLLSEARQVVQLAQFSLNSQVDTVRALSDAAQACGVTHQVILMVETGDRREGVMPEDAKDVARAMLALPGIELVGIGTNVGCIGGVLPTRENSQLLVDIAGMSRKPWAFTSRSSRADTRLTWR
jgi:predicted amino acid racemase